MTTAIGSVEERRVTITTTPRSDGEVGTINGRKTEAMKKIGDIVGRIESIEKNGVRLVVGIGKMTEDRNVRGRTLHHPEAVAHPKVVLAVTAKRNKERLRKW